MNYDAFSHGQIKSKLWLCEQIEPYLKNETVIILGSWYNVLAFMMLTRCHHKYKKITGIDLDQSCIPIANKLCDAWIVDKSDVKVQNVEGSADNVDYSGVSLVVNCSAEHFADQSWFGKIPAGMLVCIQSSNMTEPKAPWLITNPSPTLESFISKYTLTTNYMTDTLRIQYDGWGYDRYMIIGIK
jgi:hypothetical protein